MEKELFRLVVLPCFDLCRSKSFHAATLEGLLQAKSLNHVLGLTFLVIPYIW